MRSGEPRVRGARRAHSSRIAPSSVRASAARDGAPATFRRLPATLPLARAGAARPVGARCGSHRRQFSGQTQPPGVLLDTPAHFSRAVCFTHQPRRIRRESLPARSLAASIRPPLHAQRLKNAREIPLGTPKVRNEQDLFLPAAGLASGLHLTAPRHGTCEHEARAGDEQFCAVAETYGGSATEDPPFGGLWCDQPALFLLAKRGRTALLAASPLAVSICGQKAWLLPASMPVPAAALSAASLAASTCAY